MNKNFGTPELLNYCPRTFYAACQSCGRTFLGLLTAWPAALLPAFAAFLLLTSGNAYAQDSVESDRAVLVALYNATDGPNWTDNTNWLSNEPLSEWHGVATNDDGHVTELNLRRNQLTGEIPAELGNLANLQLLYLHGNELNGPIPSWLVNLTELRELSLWSNQLTGTIPPEVAPAQDRAALVVLYTATGGPNWTDNTNWRYFREPLSEWHGVSTDEQGRVEELRLSANGLNGTIGAELGVLTRLTGLYLNDNELSGTIPPELEKLTQLSLVARIGMETEFFLSQAVASGDAFEHRPSERGHCVQDFSTELDLRDLPGEAAGFEFGADDALPTAHLRFYSAALVVPCCRLPGHAPVAADLGNMAIPNGRITRRLQADHCVLWRRYDHIQGLPIPLPQQISCGRSIVGAVSQKARDRGIQLIQEAG